MAAALIGEAFLSASIQVLCDRIASADFGDLFRQKKLDEPLLMKLKTMLLTLYAVLNDAEEKQISNPAVRDWLDELKHAVFDAEDLLDEIDTEALRCKVEGEETDKLTKKVWDFFSTSRSHFYQSMNVEIQGLLQRLDDFVQQKVALGLTEVVGRNVSQRTPTTSLIHEPFVYGRDEDKENLSKVLFSNDAREDDVSIITIVGMGGVGKTTLARALYNDDKVKEHFALKSWACVSEDYDAIRVTKTLLESVTSTPCKMADLNSLQVELREQLRGNKFLFVLDDLWSEKYSDWRCLQTPFTSGARGSKVIVTTRSENVASLMKNVPIQHLKPLSHEDCWMLLAKHAFGNENHTAHPTLEEIGKKIARKCNGLPLAAETLRGLLRCQRDFEEWNRLLNSSLWELPYDKSDILPALRLSYHYLPAPLKRCFVYCSIFPKDYQFKKEDMVLLWMSEGLIPQDFNGQRMEETARRYFDELVSRSLLQISGKWGFTMHDLLNDLGQFMSRGFFLRLEERESQEVKRLRHLSYARGKIDAAKKFEPLNGAKCLRTFLPTSFEAYGTICISQKFPQDLLPSLKRLRVLSLSHYQNVAEVPDSVGNLIHLRYLDLSETAIISLPGAVCTLYNLQTLLLSGCSALIELPADMRKLINLRTLTLAGCRSLTKLPVDMRELSSLQYLDVSGTNIQGMPVEIGRLQSLRTLTDFIVGKYTGSSIAELKELHHLYGRLCISNLQNVVNVVEALEANLKDKKELKDLELEWGKEDADDSQKERDVLDKLQPCVNLEKLTIRFYGGTSFPNWLGSSNSFYNIQFMCISDCKYCLSLPSFGQLPTLKELRMKRMKFVRTVGVEFYGDLNGASVIQPFRSLKMLLFEEMPEWEDWLPSPSGGQCSDFPCLQELRIRNCPKLRGYLPNRLPCLITLSVSGCEYLHLHDEWAISSSSSLNMDYLYIDGCPGLLPLIERVEKKFLSTLVIYNFDAIQCLPKMKYLRSLTFRDCPTVSSLEFLSHEMMAELTSLEYLRISKSFHSVSSFPLGVFPKLSTLVIVCCENLESFSIEGVDQNLSHLNQLEIHHCPNLASFPDGGLPTPNLRELKVGGCKNLKSFPERIRTLTALERLELSDLLNLVSFAQGGLPPNLQYFYVRYCDKVKPSVEWGLQGLVSLKQFAIAGQNWAPLLKEQLLPTTLIGLRIAGPSSLKSVDVKGLRHLASLRRLTIEDCPSLEFLPREGLQHLTSLQELSIDSCPSLEFLPAEGLQHLTSLQYLSIYSCPSLEFLPAEGLLHLTSLQRLRIFRCPKLQFLPENGLPPSLSYLEIGSCSTLEKRYEDKTGEDWAKISHIPSIKIGKRVIISI